MGNVVQQKKKALIALALVTAISLPVEANAAPSNSCFGRRATIIGTAGDDKIEGTAGADVIVALGGADYVDGKEGNDRICLGRGGKYDSDRHFEWARGGPGNDRIHGGGGSDRLLGEGGHDLLVGGPGKDSFFGQGGRDRLSGGSGADYLNGGPGADLLKGGSGSDDLLGDKGNDMTLGGSHGGFGDTVSFGLLSRGDSMGSTNTPVQVDLEAGQAIGHGSDVIRGVENIIGTGGADELRGDARANVIMSGSGDDLLEGLRGDDCLLPSRGRNQVIGGQGFDHFGADVLFPCGRNPYSSGASPTMGVTVDLSLGYAEFDLEPEDRSELVTIEGAYGTSEQDTLLGNDGPNALFGGGGPDRIEGRAGDDHLDGGPGGGDHLDGGDHFDTCYGELVFSCEDGDGLLLRR